MINGVFVSNVKCIKCGKSLDMLEYLTSKKDYPICNKCVKKNHKRVCK